MKIEETIVLQDQRLKEICEQKGVEYDSMNTLLESVKTKITFENFSYYLGFDKL